MDTNTIIEKLEQIIEHKMDQYEEYLQKEIEDLIIETKIELQDDLCDTIENYINNELGNIELAEDNKLNDLVKQLNNKPTQQNSDIIKILQFAGVKNYQLHQQNGTLTITVKEQ